MRILEKILSAALIVGLCSCSRCPRPEDDLEPNDTFEEATPLTEGEPVEGRVVEDNLDVFSFAVDAAGTLRYTLESRAEDEHCATFVVTGPADVTLFDEDYFECPPFQRVETHASGATLTSDLAGDYVLLVPAATTGTYYLTLEELAQSDNQFAFSWDYRLVVTTEPP